VPTSEEFTRASVIFATAADAVGDFVVEIDRLDTTTILQGGELGRVIPAELDEASTRGRMCRQILERAAELCEERAAEMVEYEADLAIYEQKLAVYNAAWAEWDTRLRMGGNPTQPSVENPYPVTPPTWPEDDLGPLSSGLLSTV